MFTITWTDRAKKQLQKLPQSVGKRIYQKVGELRRDPYRNLKRLTGIPFYRLRVGDYRVILDIKRSNVLIIVLEIGERRKGYR